LLNTKRRIATERLLEQNKSVSALKNISKMLKF